jgi:hypothetical protein
VRRVQLILVCLRRRLQVELLAIATIEEAQTFVQSLRLILHGALVRYVWVLRFQSEPIPAPNEFIILDYLVMLFVHLHWDLMVVVLGVSYYITAHDLVFVAIDWKIELGIGHAIIETILIVVVHGHLRLVGCYWVIVSPELIRLQHVKTVFLLFIRLTQFLRYIRICRLILLQTFLVISCFWGLPNAQEVTHIFQVLLTV